MTERRVGSGERVSGEGEFGGELISVDGVDDVLALVGRDLSDKVLLTEQASATVLGPILPNLAGVICTAGGPSAHLAIVSRALRLSALVGAEFEADLEAGAVVRVDGAGEVWLR